MSEVFAEANSLTVMRTSTSPEACFFLMEKKCNLARASEGSFLYELPIFHGATSVAAKCTVGAEECGDFLAGE